MAILVVAGARMLAIDLDILRLLPGPPFALGGPVAVAIAVGDIARIEGHADVGRESGANDGRAQERGHGRGFQDVLHGDIPLMIEPPVQFGSLVQAARNHRRAGRTQRGSAKLPEPHSPQSHWLSLWLNWGRLIEPRASRRMEPCDA